MAQTTQSALVCPCVTSGITQRHGGILQQIPMLLLKRSHYINIVQTAERAKLDMAFLADDIGLRTKASPAGALCRSHQTLELAH